MRRLLTDTLPPLAAAPVTPSRVPLNGRFIPTAEGMRVDRLGVCTTSSD